MNFIWVFMLAGGICYAAAQGQVALMTQSAIAAAEDAVVLSFRLVGVMCLWMGVMRLAERAGLVRIVARLLRPVTALLFRGVPKDHPAMGAIVMTMSANLLGLGNAATPLGIRAMQELQKLNGGRRTASPAMCTFLAICTTGFTIVPATVIALRSAAGSANPAEIVGATILVSFLATGAALLADAVLRAAYGFGARRR